MRKYRDFLKVYKQSITNSYRQPVFWILIGVCAFADVFFIVLMPLILFWAMHNAVGGQGSNQIITMTSTILIPFFASFIAEINSTPNERVFVLSRPINRNIYLTAKFFASLTTTIAVLIIGVVCIYLVWGILSQQVITEHSRGIIIYIPPSWLPPIRPEDIPLAIIIKPKEYKFNFGDLAFTSATPLELCGNLVILTFFGTVIGQCYSIYFREAVPSVLVLLATILYTMTFSVFTFTKQSIEDLRANSLIFELQFEYLPLAIFGGGGLTLFGLSYHFNKKIDDGR